MRVLSARDNAEVSRSLISSFATRIIKVGSIKVMNQLLGWREVQRRDGSREGRGGARAAPPMSTQAPPLLRLWRWPGAHLVPQPIVLLPADGELALPLLHAGRRLLQRRGQPGVALAQGLQLDLPLLHVGGTAWQRPAGDQGSRCRPSRCTLTYLRKGTLPSPRCPEGATPSPIGGLACLSVVQTCHLARLLKNHLRSEQNS